MLASGSRVTLDAPHKLDEEIGLQLQEAFQNFRGNTLHALTKLHRRLYGFVSFALYFNKTMTEVLNRPHSSTPIPIRKHSTPTDPHPQTKHTLVPTYTHADEGHSYTHTYTHVDEGHTHTHTHAHTHAQM
eukprot:1158246-Pelagomonas_calceolata.AAC.3